jgi:hypothetical protein
LHTEKMPPKENTKTKGPVFANQKISILWYCNVSCDQTLEINNHVDM